MIINIITEGKSLLIISILTALAVEGIKKILQEKNKSYSANILAVIVSSIITIIYCVSDAVWNDTVIDTKLVWYIIDMILLSSIVAMVGYDKFKQAVLQLKK